MIEHEGWNLNTALCPVDIEFINYMYDRPGSVFHMGPGNHHKVGRSLSNPVWSITNSPDEINAYVDLLREDPVKGWMYKCMYGDIYALDVVHLPMFNYVTLFHLGETFDDRRLRYCPFTDEEVIRNLLERTTEEMLFYTGSAAWQDRIRPIVYGLPAGLITIEPPVGHILPVTKR